MKKTLLHSLIATVILGSSQVMAEDAASNVNAFQVAEASGNQEINPFTGAHGELEKLKLETEIAQQRNKLLLEQIEEMKNQQKLKSEGGIPNQGVLQGAPVQPGMNTPAYTQDGASSSLSTQEEKDRAVEEIKAAVEERIVAERRAEEERIAAAKAEAEAKTRAKRKAAPPAYTLEAVFDGGEGLRAVVSQGGKVTTISIGDSLGKARVAGIEDNKLKLSNGRTIDMRQGQYGVVPGAWRAPNAEKEATNPASASQSGQPNQSGMNYDAEIGRVMGSSPPAVFGTLPTSPGF